MATEKWRMRRISERLRLLAEVLIVLLVVLDIRFYVMVYQSRSHGQQFPVFTTPVKPVLYIKENVEAKRVKVIGDVCKRWGYNVERIRYTEGAAHPDKYLRLYMNGMKYRILQTHLPDKIIDYVPVVNEMITYKANLVKNGGKYIPIGFVLPDQKQQFLHYVYSPENNATYWIQKNRAHRGNVIVPLEELDLNKPSLVQEYVGNPFIIDGRKFSIGVFVVFSSGNPLRAYVIDSTIEWRFCEKEYYPENIHDPATYVTDGLELYNIKVAAHIEPLKSYKTKHYYSSRKSFETYMKMAGEDPSKVFTQIYDAIRDVLARNAAVIERKSNPRNKYIEITRWDFIVDANMNVDLVESNISPSFAPSASTFTKVYKQYCDHIVYNSFRAIGLERPSQWKHSSSFYIRDTDVSILQRVCYTSVCVNCRKQECLLCSHCLTEHQVWLLKQMTQEHLQRGTARLVYPFIQDGSEDNTVLQEDKPKSDMDVLHNVSVHSGTFLSGVICYESYFAGSVFLDGNLLRLTILAPDNFGNYLRLSAQTASNK